MMRDLFGGRSKPRASAAAPQVPAADVMMPMPPLRSTALDAGIDQGAGEYRYRTPHSRKAKAGP